MATYKAEFLSHYWKWRPRPRQAYALGLIPWEARAAARFPRLANFALQQEPLARWSRRAAGVEPERAPPTFATQTFKSWWADRGPGRPPAARGKVLLWADTFNDHFHPEVAIAATRALEAGGFEVVVPIAPLCCGRPLYDYGMLAMARRQLRRILDALADEIEAGTPLVTLEPSCGAVFRDELVSMFPDDPQAKRLARMTSTLGEFFAREGEDVELPRLGRKALVHLHCHQKATSDTDCDLAVLERLGVDAEVLDSGCCGLAGSFGYEAGEHYEISIKAAERVLMPALRDADPGTMVITDGFSCRSQIEHCGEPAPLHLAQVLEAALAGGK
jgi:Fe-S oxidoreductase